MLIVTLRVRVNKIECALRVILIGLYVVGKPDGKELDSSATLSYSFNCELGEAPTERGINTTGDPKNESAGPRRPQVVGKELDSLFDLLRGVDNGLNSELRNDLFLQLTHV